MPNISKSEHMDTFKGINNVLPADKSIDGYFKEQVNLDIDKSNNLSKRKGFILKDSANYHSLWSDGFKMYAVRNGDLVRLYEDSSFLTLVSSIGDSRVTFEIVDSVYYYTSKFRSGQIRADVAYPWGIDIPSMVITLTETVGTLPKGDYQVSLTYSTLDGRESGASVSSRISVTGNSSVLVSGIPPSSHSEVVSINIYMTTTNGEVLYRVGSITNGTTTTTISSLTGGRPLETFNLYPAPKGSIVRWFSGRMYIAQDNILWWSEPYQYDHFDFTKNYYYFDEEITAVCPMPGGIWVSSDKIYYISGKDPHEGRLTEKGLARVVRGSDVKFSGAYIFIENTPLGYKWLVTTDLGIFVLFNDGVILNISEQNVSFPKAHDAAAGFIQEDGINRYVSLLREKEDSNNTAIGDMVTSTIIRNGITIT